jgi:hypothetical protein
MMQYLLYDDAVPAVAGIDHVTRLSPGQWATIFCALRRLSDRGQILRGRERR